MQQLLQLVARGGKRVFGRKLPAQFAAAPGSAERTARAFARDIGDEFDSTFGAPTQRLPHSGGRSAVVPEEGAAAPPAAPPASPNITAAERELLLAQLRERGLLAPAVPAP